MNTRTSLIATAASLALFSAANGQTIVDIVGSTAGRSTVDARIKTLVPNTTSISWYTTDGRTVASSASADGAIYRGGTLGGQPVTIRTFWAGSATGVDLVANEVQLNNQLFKTTWNVAGQVTGDTAAVIAADALALASTDTVAEFGFSDVKQNATVHQQDPLTEQTPLFVIPFRWYASESTTGITNITSQMARVHYTGGGETDKSLFTGLLADDGTKVYAVGRDGDSGTRITAFAEAGAGAFAQVFQWEFDTITTPGVNTGPPTEVFNGGFASGGSVATILGNTGFQAIGYLGISDSTTAQTAGAIPLTYNGVPFSIANVQNGNYTFWSTYQMLRERTLTGQALSLFGTLKTELIALATSGSGSSIKLSTMNVTREGDGADVLPK